MKIVLALCAALLLGFSSQAQLPQTFNGTFSNASATNNWYYTPPVVTPIVASSCAQPKTIAGSFTTNANTEIRYDTYTVTNTAATPACLTLSLTPTCGPNAATLLLTVFRGGYTYGGNYTTATLSTFTANYLGDAGAYSAGPTACSIQVGAGQSILAVVNTNNLPASRSCASYTLTAAVAPAPTPLPVTLVSFDGQATAAGNVLDWVTASEQGNLGFVVERSPDGYSFVALGRVAGSGTRSQKTAYRYLDAAPLLLGYYRLRQQDSDGSEHFSPVITVRAGGAPPFFPNPVLDQVTFTSPTATRLIVRDGLGRTCQVVPLAAGSQPVSLATLPAGVYSVTNEATHQTVRLVKASQQ